MKILVKGFGDLEEAIGTTLSEQFNVVDYALVNASQAYAVVARGEVNMGAAFHLDLEDSSLYLIGSTEDKIDKTEVKKLNMMPGKLLNQLGDGIDANREWREQNKKYLNRHQHHIFRGAIMTSNNPPEAYDHGALSSFIVTHPASKSAFDLDGNSVEVPQFLRGFYKVNSVPTLDISTMREGVNSAPNVTKIMLTNLSIQNKGKELTARYLDLPPTPPILVVSEAGSLNPVAMSKEPITFNSINAWGEKHNISLGIDKPFIIDNSENIQHFINDEKVEGIKSTLKSNNKLQEYRTPAS